MKRSRFTEEQIIAVLREHQTRAKVADRWANGQAEVACATSDIGTGTYTKSS
jgi:hypothetical protein